MIIDKYNLFSNAQEVTTSAASESVYDNNGGDPNTDLYLEIVVDETVTATGSATVTFALETDSDEAFGSATTLFTTAAIGKADLTVGTVPVKIKLPLGLERYVRIYYTVATGPLTAGKFSAYVTPNTYR